MPGLKHSLLSSSPTSCSLPGTRPEGPSSICQQNNNFKFVTLCLGCSFPNLYNLFFLGAERWSKLDAGVQEYWTLRLWCLWRREDGKQLVQSSRSTHQTASGFGDCDPGGGVQPEGPRRQGSRLYFPSLIHSCSLPYGHGAVMLATSSVSNWLCFIIMRLRLQLLKGVTHPGQGAGWQEGLHGGAGGRGLRKHNQED